MGVAHIPLYFGLGRERGNRVDNDYVNGARTHERFAYVESLFARIGLGDIELVGIDAESLCIGRIEGMFRIDERGNSTEFLRLRNYMQGHRRLA